MPRDWLRSALDLEPFGNDTWLVRSVPAVFGQADPGLALEEVLEGIADGRDLVGETREAALTASDLQAGRHQRAARALSLEEMRQLVRQLEACQKPRVLSARTPDDAGAQHRSA